MRTRSRKKGFDPPEFTLEEIEHVVKHGKCALTNRKFDHTIDWGYRISPFLPSPDRLSPAVGYTKQNVRWCMHWLNQARNSYDLEDLMLLMRGVKW